VYRDLVEGYLFPDDTEGMRSIDQHLALGVSLGGHSVWQLMFAEPRVTAGVVVIGCPDYMSEFMVPSFLRRKGLNRVVLTVIPDLLSDRARLSKLATYSAQDSGASFLGSRDFPPSLVEACKKYDPKGILFGASTVPDVKSSGAEDEPTRKIVQKHLRGKKFLLCSGGDDKLVPYRCSEPFLKWFKQATETWFREEGVSVDDRVYPGIGHAFSKDMVADAVSFIVDAVANAERSASPSGGDEQRTSKI
jgi:pimeloyl-ACP methyl ester carboxylesterase